MSDFAIQVKDLSKLYRIGQKIGGKSLRESITTAVTSRLRCISSMEHSLPAASQEKQVAVRKELSADCPPGHIWALKDVSFEVKCGESVSVIGKNGSGKSTLLKILSRIVAPTRGYAEIHGRVGSLLEIGTGFHPELTGRENIFFNGVLLGLGKSEVERRFDQIVAFSEIEKFLDTPVKHYSSGMYTRLAFSIAVHLGPDVLLLDEVLAVGDTAFQKKCMRKIGEVVREGRAVLFVSHSMEAVQELCTRALLLVEGHLVKDAPSRDVILEYLSLLQ